MSMTKNSEKDSVSVMQLFAFGTMTTLAGSQTPWESGLALVNECNASFK